MNLNYRALVFAIAILTTYVNADFFSNSLYVSQNGNDTTGIRNDTSKPFKTIGAALSKAIAGDVVVIYPSTYVLSTPLVLSNLVSLKFLGAGTLLLSTVQTTGSLLTDGGRKTTSYIDAPDWTFTARGQQSVLKMTAATLIATVGSFISTYGDNCEITDKADLNLTAKKLLNNGGPAVIQQERGSKVTLKVDYAESKTGYVFAAHESNFYCTAGRIYASNPIERDDNSCVIAVGGHTNTISVIANDIDSASGWPIWIVGSITNAYVRANRIATGGDCNVVSGTSGMLTVSALEISSYNTGIPSYGILHGEDGNLTCIASRLVGNGFHAKTSGDGTICMIAVQYNPLAISENLDGSIRKCD